ncbi:uncharacterized protein LOC127433702 isoform X2 [Myxocyprinus asiaticus]|uniref:uncharacterized protein LOC127433702 isoform X2 n=1 Tax=Myxocyprinus asiaticus TaxID=70543 RepID=UPI0022225C7A|nr:uncharacterized protein LOC127433702 isoform X2 [Myxocyprinus asiaticus]
MEGEQDRRNFKTSGNLSISRGYTGDPWHSTPVKKNLFAADATTDVSSSKLRDGTTTKPAALSLRDLSKTMPSLSLSQDFQTSANGLEGSTIQRQRVELQLLIAELKDRDQELNSMAAAHHRQLLSWEQDRQRVLILEQRCARLEDELQKRNDVIRALSKRTKVMEAKEKDIHRELNSTQRQLHELSQRELTTTRYQQELEEKNQSLNSTVMMLSTQVGQLQVREEELSSMLRLKDKDVIEATNHILELSGRLCELEKSLEELRTRESKTLRDTEEHKHRFRESRHENTQLRAELQEKTIENNSQREEAIRLKQENQLLKKELTAIELQLLGEDKSWKDELLELSRSKQARAESELLCLRQVCENQQNDLQLLKLNLESARETLRTHEGQRSHGRSDSGLGASHVLEYSDCQGTELDTGLRSSQFHNTSKNTPSILTHHPCVEMETQTDLDGMTLNVPNHEVKEKSAIGETVSGLSSAPCAGRQCHDNEQDSLDCYKEGKVMEKPSKENNYSKVSPPAALPALCRENTDSPTDSKPHQAVYSEAGGGVDFVAVIDYDPGTGTPICLVDVDISPRFPCMADLSCLHLDCPSPSPQSLHDSVLSIEFNGNEEGYSSSTSRLQRLLADSREMVASLENCTRKLVSPAQSPTDDAVCRLQSKHGNGSNHKHSQHSTHDKEGSQTSREHESQSKSSPH